MRQLKLLSLLLAFCWLDAGMIIAEELPKEIVLRGDTTTGLYREGKFSRTVKLDAGQALQLLRFEKGNFVAKYEDGEVRIDRFNTELARTNMAALLRSTQVTNAPAAPVGAVATLTPERAYNKAKLALVNGRANESQYLGDDANAVRLLIEGAEAVVKAYENGQTNKALDLWKQRMVLDDEVFMRSKINAYKYNEFVKGDVIVPVVFDLYSGGEAFYLKVGDGSFSTVTSVPLEDWKRFLDSVHRVDTWITTCRREKLETRKEICTVGTSIFTFVAFDQGREWYVLMEIRGTMRNKALLEEQKVKLTPLNYWRLYERMRQALQIAQTRLKQEEAAERLR